MKNMLQSLSFPRMVAPGLAAALAAVCVAATSAAAQTGADKLGWTLAVHSYTFKEFPIHDAIDMTAALGIKHMSVSGGVNLAAEGGLKRVPTTELPQAEYDAILTRMKAKALSPTFVNMGVVHPTADEAATRKLFENTKRLGIPVIVAEPDAKGKMEELPKVMDLLEKLATEFQIKVAIHNHPGPKNFYWKPEVVLAAVQGRSPLLGACADVGHWVRSGLDPVECLRKLEGRIICLHFKDLNQKGPKAHDVPWGTGISNVKAMMAELKRQRFQGAFCVEYEHNWRNSSPEIAQSAKFFHEVCEELAK
jgi:sugar phosphate isomerase/epimerase